MSGFNCDEDRNFGENRGALFYEWDNVLFVHFVLLITLEGQTVASMRSLHLLNRSACQDLTATRIATLVRIAGALFYDCDNVLFVHLVLLIIYSVTSYQS